jgi:hypothetical protein
VLQLSGSDSVKQMRKSKAQPIIDDDFLEFANAEKSESVEVMLKSHSRKNIKRLMVSLKELGFEFTTNGKIYPDEKTGKEMLWLKNVRYVEPGEVEADELPDSVGSIDDVED